MKKRIIPTQIPKPFIRGAVERGYITQEEGDALLKDGTLAIGMDVKTSNLINEQILTGGVCVCGEWLPCVDDDDTPYQFCSQECKDRAEKVGLWDKNVSAEQMNKDFDKINALYKAAPEMLEALKMVRGFAALRGDAKIHQEVWEDAMAAVEKAVNKAEGGE